VNCRGADEQLIEVVGPVSTWNPHGPQGRAGEVSTVTPWWWPASSATLDS
jgi:hypothetical protein